KMVYLQIYDWPQSATLALEGLPRVLRARVLTDGKPLALSQNAQGISIQLPPQPPDPNVSVLALEMA
ncbi:MAG: alpha-L-fucosidase, partial [Terriglobia bacterium]